MRKRFFFNDDCEWGAEDSGAEEVSKPFDHPLYRKRSSRKGQRKESRR